MREDLEDKYYDMFGNMPPLFKGLSYKHPLYVKMLEEAVRNHMEITGDMLNKMMKENEVEVDIVDDEKKANRLFGI